MDQNISTISLSLDPLADCYSLCSDCEQLPHVLSSHWGCHVRATDAAQSLWVVGYTLTPDSNKYLLHVTLPKNMNFLHVCIWAGQTQDTVYW